MTIEYAEEHIRYKYIRSLLRGLDEKRRRGLFPSAALGYHSLGPCRRRLAFCSSR